MPYLCEKENDSHSNKVTPDNLLLIKGNDFSVQLAAGHEQPAWKTERFTTAIRSGTKRTVH